MTTFVIFLVCLFFLKHHPSPAFLDTTVTHVHLLTHTHTHTHTHTYTHTHTHVYSLSLPLKDTLSLS